MKLKLFLLAVSTVFALPMDAQSRLRSTRVHNTDTLPALVKQYMDSLKVTKANIDSAVVEANTNDGKYYRLFAPLTFYHGVSENMFALEKNGENRIVRSLIYTLIVPTWCATHRGNLIS